MSSYTSVDQIIDTQVLKLNNIQCAINLINLQIKQPNTISEKHKCDLMRVISKYKRLKDAFKTQKHLISDIKVLQVKFNEVADRTEISRLNVGLTEVVSPYLEPVNDVQPQKASGSSYEYTPDTEIAAYYQKDLKPMTLKFKFMEIEHITDEEYRDIPKYMVRRINLASINRFIDLFNKALSDKYELISKPMKNLRGNELQIYREYKAQETIATKGKHFVRELNVASLLGKKLFDKQSHNIITILRHTKRIFENRLRGVVDYVLM